MNKFNWHQLSEYKYVLALLVFTVLIIFIGDSSIINRIGQKREIASLRNQIQEQKKEFESQKEELSSIRTKLSTVKRVAREKYFMKASNEDVFVFRDEE